MIEIIQMYLSFALTIVGLFGASLTFLMKLIKSSRGRKRCEQLLNITNKIIPFIEEAESFLNYSGNEKKEYVMTKTRQFIFENKFKISEVVISDKIEELIALTKNVNFNQNLNKDSNNLILDKLLKKEGSKNYE